MSLCPCGVVCDVMCMCAFLRMLQRVGFEQQLPKALGANWGSGAGCDKSA